MVSLGLLLSPHASSAQQHARGASAHAADPVPPRLPAASPLIDVRVHAAEREFEIVLGPVSLPAGGPHLRPPVQLAELPVAGWVHGFSWR
ncbi:MAG: hypothetical protein F4012_03070, partial [Gemmatimonadales bacterium]|nr:hypothetical protein [Gemmatimonadales bacterium]